MSDKDTIYRQAAIDAIKREIWDKHTAKDVIDTICNIPSAQPEYTEHEESILTMLFGIAQLIIDLQGGYMEMTDGRSFDNNDLFILAEKLGINY